jgi:Xaa-Pro aminopeptidase
VGISRLSKTKFKAGMVVTNEPGYYCEGKFGIRIENMLLVREEAGFNFFENLTLCPYDRNLIDLGLLDGPTREHIDRYHRRVWVTLSPLLKGDEETLVWLRRSTAAL